MIFASPLVSNTTRSSSIKNRSIKKKDADLRNRSDAGSITVKERRVKRLSECRA